MAERIDTDRLEVILASVGHHLIVEPVGDDDAADRRDRGPWRERLLVAAVVGACPVGRRRLDRAGPTGGVGLVARREHRGRNRPGSHGVARVAGVRRRHRSAGRGAPRRRGSVSPCPMCRGRRSARPDAWWSPPERGILATWSQDATSLWIVATADTFPASLDKWLREPECRQSRPRSGSGRLHRRGRPHLPDPVPNRGGQLGRRLDRRRPHVPPGLDDVPRPTTSRSPASIAQRLGLTTDGSPHDVSVMRTPIGGYDEFVGHRKVESLRLKKCVHQVVR